MKRPVAIATPAAALLSAAAIAGATSYSRNYPLTITIRRSGTGRIA
jgi:hypothetical protein